MTIELDRTSGFFYLLLRDVVPAGVLTEMVESLGSDPVVVVDDPMLAAIARRATEMIEFHAPRDDRGRTFGGTGQLRRPGEGQGQRIRVEHVREDDDRRDWIDQ